MKTSYRDFPVVGTEFSQYETEYFLNKDGLLEEYPAPRDCQAIIDASKETVFQRILEQLSEVPESFVNPSSDYIEERENYASDLDILLAADDLMNEYKAEHPEFKGTKQDLVKTLKLNIERSYEDYAKVQAEQKSKQEEFPANGQESTQA